MNAQCPLHAQPISRICIDEKCDLQPFLCVECFKTHGCQKYEVQNGIEEFAKKLNVNLTEFDRINQQFKQIDAESFGPFIKQQQQKIKDDMHQLKKEIDQKFEDLETKLLELLDEQLTIFNKNVTQFKQQMKETEKFQLLQKSSELSMLNLKLSNHNDPIGVMKKLKSQLLSYSNCIQSGKLKQLQEFSILLQSQASFPPTYKSKDFQNNEFNRLINQFEQYLTSIESNIKQYIKYFPLTDYEFKNQQKKQGKKGQKLIEEDQCITSIILLKKNLVYALNDMNIKIRDNTYNEIEVIQCDTQINCIIEINSKIDPKIQQQIIVNKNQSQDLSQTQLALAGDEFTLIWQFNQNQIIEQRKLQHQRMSKAISLLGFDNFLLIGDWDGQIFGYDLNIQNPLYIVDTQTTILFSILKSKKFIITSSKSDFEQGGVIFWNFNQKDLYQEKRIEIQQVQRQAYSNEQLFIVDNKNKLYIYDCQTKELIKSFICSESFVNDIAIDNNTQTLYILNQTCLKFISDQIQWNYQSFDDFPCLQCRQYFQSCRLIVNNGMIIFIRHLHLCIHEQGEDEKCQMKSTLYIQF